MVVIVGIIGVATILYLAMRPGANAGTIDTSVPVSDPAGVADDPITGAWMSNDSADSQNEADTAFAPNTSVAGGGGIVPTDPDTWPAGDAIWDVCRAIAHQEGYGVSAANAPTRNNNPGDISDGFDKYGGEQLDSKITKFPTPEEGWAQLYQKLLRVQQGRSKVFSNNNTWAQFGHTYAADPKWATGVVRSLGVSVNDRVGDFWNA